jgi:hypothetical protein
MEATVLLSTYLRKRGHLCIRGRRDAALPGARRPDMPSISGSRGLRDFCRDPPLKPPGATSSPPAPAPHRHPPLPPRRRRLCRFDLHRCARSTSHEASLACRGAPATAKTAQDCTTFDVELFEHGAPIRQTLAISAVQGYVMAIVDLWSFQKTRA